MKIETETLREIWNNEDKTHYEIGPDRDGLGCVEIRYYDEDHILCGTRMTFPPEMARHIAYALEICSKELDNTKETK